MSDNILYESQQPMPQEPKRPTFLTVLCILTFIGSALSLISAIYGYFSIRASAALFDTSMEGAGQSGMMGELQETMHKAVENAVPNLIIGVICSLLCLFGAIQMWKQLKMGFYIYCVGELVPPVAGFILGAGGMLGSVGAVVGLLIAGVWVVLYALNLKHMK